MIADAFDSNLQKKAQFVSTTLV